jgi:ABC-type glycerol-3-phosphate transport system substrate-binding protein
MRRLKAMCIAAIGIASIAVVSAESSNKQVLSVWSINDPQPVQDAIDEWAKKNPDIDLKITYFASEDLKTQTRLAVDAKKAPDVMLTNAGTTFWEYVDKGAAADLTATAKKYGWQGRGDKSYFDVYRRDGKLYAVPFSGVTLWQTLYLNEKIFTDNNIPAPKTIDDLVSAAKQLRKKNIQTLAFGDKDGWPAIILLGDLFLQEGSFDLIAKINSGEIKWTKCTPMKNALSAIIKLARNDVFMSGYLSSDHNLAIQAWAAGKTAALYNGSWWNQVTQSTDLGFPIKVISLPLVGAGDKLKGVQASADMALFITPSTKVFDAAARFLDFACSENAQKIRAEAMGAFPIYPGLTQKMSIDPLFKADPIQKQLSLPASGIFFDHAFPIPVVEVMKTSIQFAMEGKITVDEALQKIQDKQNEVLKR